MVAFGLVEDGIRLAGFFFNLPNLLPSLETWMWVARVG